MTTSLTPTATTIAAVQAVIDRVAEGAYLKDAAAAEGVTTKTFHVYISRERELGVSYARAKELRADLLADEGLRIVDDSTIDANRARNQYQYRQWLASKLNPKTYGERIDLNVSQTVSISEALAAARARVRPVCDLSEVTDVEVLDNKGNSPSEPSDTGTDAPSNTAQVAALPAPGLAIQAALSQLATPSFSQVEGLSEPDIFA